MRTVILMVAAAAALLTSTAASGEYKRDTVIRTKCIGDRCALYDRYGTRVGSVTTESTGRLAVRDRDGKLQAKVTPETNGQYRVRRW